MKKRNEKDVKIIEAGSLTKGELKKWIIDLFYGRASLNFHTTGDVFELWMSEAINCYEKAESKKIRQMILIKVLHTREVVDAGMDITKNTGEEDWDQFMVCTVCLLHDIARFRQALLGSYSDKESNFDHAKEGEKIVFESHLPEIEEMRINKKIVCEAISAHSGFSYEGSDIYAKLTRDSDKLALLRFMPYLMNNERYPSGKVDEKALMAFKNGEMVKNINIHSRADILLAWLCWENDLNFSATKNLFIEEGVKDWIKGELKIEGVEF